MSVKLIMTWNIKPGKEQDYFHFVVGEYLPQISRYGLELTDAWATIYGDQPQILVGALLPDIETARDLIDTQAWQKLHQTLFDFVDDFQLKIVDPKGAFQF